MQIVQGEISCSYPALFEEFYTDSGHSARGHIRGPKGYFTFPKKRA